MSTTQLAFDFDTMLLMDMLADLPAWDGAPLGYHEEHRSPAELDAAWDRYRLVHGNHGCVPHSHMWNRLYCNASTLAAGAHTLDLFSAEAQCPDEREAGHSDKSGDLPGNTRFQAICAPCGWRHLSDDESAVIEAWHDHAFPGWRELPTIPSKVTGIPGRGKSKLQGWIEERYPDQWQMPGYPIITARGGVGTRHVPGRSPWGGYDLSDSAL